MYLLKNQLRQESAGNQDDARLVTLLQDGNEQACDLLVSRWNTAIFNFCLRMLGDHDDAAECTQRVFIKMYRKIGMLTQPASFRSWLFQIAANQCRDEIKRRKRFSFFSINETDDKATQGLFAGIPSTADSDPELLMQQLQQRELIRQALNRLTVEQREIVIMKELHQLTFPEIASALGIPESTVKSRLYAGLRALHPMLSTSVEP